MPTQLSASYDAWNRLVEIQNGATKLVESVYDARGYRIRKDTYTSGTLSESRHYYYTPGWQCVEERLDTSTTVERQFVWGLRYIDDLVLRDRSTVDNGTMNERRYGLQDGNWNMIAICNTTGSVTERYAYSAYGAPVFMIGAVCTQPETRSGRSRWNSIGHSVAVFGLSYRHYFDRWYKSDSGHALLSEFGMELSRIQDTISSILNEIAFVLDLSAQQGEVLPT